LAAVTLAAATGALRFSEGSPARGLSSATARIGAACAGAAGNEAAGSAEVGDAVPCSEDDGMADEAATVASRTTLRATALGAPVSAEEPTAPDAVKLAVGRNARPLSVMAAPVSAWATGFTRA
jgi:hypothetical protein